MNLPRPPQVYSQEDEAQTRSAIGKADGQNVKVGAPIILVASDKSRWKLVVGTDGTLSTVAA